MKQRTGKSGNWKKETVVKLCDIIFVAPSMIDGRGVFAKTQIKKGEYIGTYEGPRAKRNGKYVLWVVGNGKAAGRCGKNQLRYLNHADRPNAEFEGFDLYACQTIGPGDEVTINYNGG